MIRLATIVWIVLGVCHAAAQDVYLQNRRASFRPVAAVPGGVGTDPTNVAGLYAQWVADDIGLADGAAVSNWTDRVSSWTLSQLTNTSYMPYITNNVWNGHDALSFNADVLWESNTTFCSYWQGQDMAYTMFLVGKRANTNVSYLVVMVQTNNLRCGIGWRGEGVLRAYDVGGTSSGTSTYDQGGVAESIAWRLYEHYRGRGHDSAMVVGEKVGRDPQVIPLSQASARYKAHSSIASFSRKLSSYEGPLRGICRMRRWLEAYVAHPDNWWETCLGRDHFNFPETWRLLELSPADPDILHCHNLHGGWLSRGGYFDLRALPELCRTIPTIITLHDTWMLSGHCAYTLGCERWKTGCGHCPDLSIYPAISRDGTAENWQRKRDIYAACRLYVSTPSRAFTAAIKPMLQEIWTEVSRPRK